MTLTQTAATTRVAEGVVFSDGTCVLRWLTRTGSVAVYLNGADMEKVHGHDGKTRVVWDDDFGGAER